MNFFANIRIKQNTQDTNSKYSDPHLKIIYLIETVEKIYKDKNFQINFQLTYSKCHEICQNRMASELFSSLNTLLARIVNTHHENLMLYTNEDDFVNYLIDTFFKYKNSSATVSDSLLYMDRIREKYNICELNIYDNCLSKFFNIFASTDIKVKIFDAFSNKLLRLRTIFINSRNDFIYHYNEFQNFIKIVIEIKLFYNSNIFKNNTNNFYYQEFLPRLYETTENLYSKLFQDYFLVENDYLEEEIKAIKFLETIFDIINKEDSLWKDLTEERNKIIEIITDNLVLKNSNFIFDSGVKFFLINKNFENLSLCYKIFCKNDYNQIKNNFYTKFQELILSLFKELNTNFVKKNNFNIIEYFNFYHYTEQIYDTKKKLYDILSNCFENNTKLEQIIKSSCESIVNRHTEFLKNFVKLLHEEIKISVKNRNSKVKEFNDKFVNIFKLISDKDLFEIEYRKYLAKRLLRNSTMINETEADFYKIMKKESGANYVKKIESMLNDIFDSQDLNSQFRSLKKSNNYPKNKIDFYVKILSSDNWPLDEINGVNYLKSPSKNFNACVELNNIQTKSVNLPNLLDNYVQEFTSFYYDKFKNRQLIWVHDISWAEITGRFLFKNYSFIVSAYQMAILYMFNFNEVINLIDIFKGLGIRDKENEKIENLFTHLYPLFQKNILITNGQNSDTKSINNFLTNISNKNYNFNVNVNTKFNSKENKIILNYKKRKETQTREIKDTNEINYNILEDRKHLVDAAIIKILKNEKRINFEKLKTKIVESVNNYFIPDINVIKNRLDNLTDRNFIARDLDDPNFFNYTA